MKYTIFNKLTGQILRIVNTIDIDLQIKNEESYIDGNYDDSLYYIQNNLPVLLPVQPNLFSIFDWSIHKWIDNSSNASYLIINKRNKLLYESDWTQIPNNPLTAEQQQAWAVYRQELRDITSQSGYPFNVIWPTPPQG
jgi:hypothetical protein